LPSLIKKRHNIHNQLRENEQRIRMLEEQIQASQKLAALGTMACMAAHEFNNLLMPIINYSELALQNQDDLPLIRKALEKAVKHGHQASQAIKSMLNLAGNSSLQYQKVDLAEIVQECFQALVRDFHKDNIVVHINIPSKLLINVIPCQIQQVILNLIINARQAMLETGGTLTINAGIQSDKSVTIRIADTGCGISPDKIDKIFDPFFSTKINKKQPDQRGSGLGLLICREIIEAHHGSIHVTSQPNQGTTFTVTLPPSVSE